MDERIGLISKYNLWKRNIIESGYARKSYTDKISQYIGNRIIKVLINGRRRLYETEKNTSEKVHGLW